MRIHEKFLSVAMSVVLAVGLMPGLASAQELQPASVDQGAEVAAQSVTIQETSGDYVYTLDAKNQVTITGYTGSDTELVIPDSIDGHPVVEIGSKAFSGNSSITSVTFPNTLGKLGDDAFLNCTALKTVAIPASLTTGGVNRGSFSGCSQLDKVLIESGATSIVPHLLRNCPGIKSVGVTDGASVVVPSTVTSIGKQAFEGCDNLESVALSDGVTFIGARAFKGCKALSSAPLPKSLEGLDSEAFCDDDLLTSIVVPRSLKECGQINAGSLLGPFKDCDGLKTVQFEDGTSRVPRSLLAGCSGIEKVDIPPTVTSIDENSFQSCVNLTTVSIPDSVTIIGTQAFANCSKLSSAPLPKSLKTLESKAFSDDDNLTAIIVPKSLEECGSTTGPGPFEKCDGLKTVGFEEGALHVPAYLLKDCPGITSMVIPSTVSSIDDGAFSNCANLETVVIPDSVTEVGRAAFAGSVKLSRVEIPDSVTSMGTQTFNGCTGLVEAHIPNTRVSLVAEMFKGCFSLTTVNMPNTLETIGADAFNGCLSLASIDIPAGVTVIGKQAFRECDALTSIAFPKSVTSIGSSAFYGCDALADVALSTGLTAIPSEAFSNCASLESIVLPYRIASIDSNAFANCVKLSSIHIPRATTSIADSVFSYPSSMTIKGSAGTTAQEYAESKSIAFEAQVIPATSIEASEADVTLLKGQTASIAVDIEPMNFTDEIIWKSSDTSIATVTTSGGAGVIKAVGVGDTTVKLVVGEQAVSIAVTVLQPVTNISFDEGWLNLEGGDEVQIVATVSPDDAYDSSLEWASSDELVATVDQDGKVVALKKGSATITATAKDGSGRKAAAFITVTCNVFKVDDAGELESAHPYESDGNDVWVYTLPEAEALNVAFDERTSTEAGADYIRVYTGAGELVGSYSGTELAGETVKVLGDTVRIRLESDAALNDWGFKVASVTATEAPKSDDEQKPDNEQKPDDGTGDGDKQEAGDDAKPGSDQPASATTEPSDNKTGNEGVEESQDDEAAKVPNPMKVSGKTAKVKRSSKRAVKVKASSAYKFTKNAAGTVTYTRVSKGSSKWLSKVDKKTGAITVKKGAPKMTHVIKVRVKAAGNANYEAAAKTVTVKVKVK